MIVLQIVWDVLEDPQSIAEIKSKNPEGYMDEFIAFAKFLTNSIQSLKPYLRAILYPNETQNTQSIEDDEVIIRLNIDAIPICLEVLCACIVLLDGCSNCCHVKEELVQLGIADFCGEFITLRHRKRLDMVENRDQSTVFMAKQNSLESDLAKHITNVSLQLLGNIVHRCESAQVHLM